MDTELGSLKQELLRECDWLQMMLKEYSDRVKDYASNRSCLTTDEIYKIVKNIRYLNDGTISIPRRMLGGRWRQVNFFKQFLIEEMKFVERLNNRRVNTKLGSTVVTPLKVINDGLKHLLKRVKFFFEKINIARQCKVIKRNLNDIIISFNNSITELVIKDLACKLGLHINRQGKGKKRYGVTTLKLDTVGGDNYNWNKRHPETVWHQESNSAINIFNLAKKILNQSPYETACTLGLI